MNRPEPDPVPNERLPVWQTVIADMVERERMGREKYGVPLQAFNGRQPLKDAYQEVLDLAVYIRQRITEDEEEAQARAAGEVDWALVDRVAQSILDAYNDSGGREGGILSDYQPRYIARLRARAFTAITGVDTRPCDNSATNQCMRLPTKQYGASIDGSPLLTLWLCGQHGDKLP